MQETKTPLTDEEKANIQLLETTDGILTGVTDPDKLIGSLVLPDGITEIDMLAFPYCFGLTSIIIPDSVTKIGDYAFFGCTGLTELSVDSENPAYCSENNILYTKDKKHLIATAGGLKGRVVLPDGVTEIGACAFKWCTDLTSIVIPGSVTEIAAWAFYRCWNLKKVIIESTIIKHIGEDAFKRVNADIHFTVKTDAVKAMLKKNATIRDEQITVEPNANSL